MAMNELMTTKSPLPTRERRFLLDAADYLEHPSLLFRLAETIGQPFEKIATRVVPARVADLVGRVMKKAMTWASATVGPTDDVDRSLELAYDRAVWKGLWHQLSTVVTGGVAGLFGFPGMAVELPVTTAIMFRSIAAIAEEFGEDVLDPAVRLECLSVFSYVGASTGTDVMNSSYLTSRLAMSQLIRDAAQFVAKANAQTIAEAIERGTAPALVKFMSRIAAQFDIAVTEKFLAQSIPVLSVATGAAINAAFAQHFNRVASFHFGVRKLERQFGVDVVRAIYQDACRELTKT
jgi:hypothetical protein